jgi:poly(3-hydroxybutyrate) depolymerase
MNTAATGGSSGTAQGGSSGAATGGSGATGGSTTGGAGASGAAAGMDTSGGRANTGGRPGSSGAGGSAAGMTPMGGSGGATTGGMPNGGSGAVSAGGAGPTSPGCGSANTTSPCGTKGTTCSMDIAGTMRTYYVQLPSNYDASHPYKLIFQFHPWGGSADQALTMYRLNQSIPDAIYVTPQGLDAGGNGPGWANTDGVDIEFTKGMLAEVQGKYCVDNSRIFSTGFSYGGMMSFAIGCEMSDVFRAIAPMSGSLYSDFNCKGTGPHIAMWGSHGTSDTVVPIEDGEAARDKILAENHCGTTTMPVDPSPCVKYQGCDAGYDVTWCEWDGPHGIPSFGSAAIATFFNSF